MNFTGTLYINVFGNGFVNCLDKVIFIPKNSLNYALHNDIVSGIITEKTDKGFIGKITSEPLFIGKTFLGRIHHIYKTIPYIYIDKLGKSLVITNISYPHAQKGNYVIIYITHINNSQIYGDITNHFTNDFTDEIIETYFNLKKEQIPHFSQQLSTPRLDLRHHNVFTIDPPGSKDLDDAFSIIHNLENNTSHIFIHIADITDYITWENIEEIMLRANTFYGISQNWPLLPREFSEGKCSILPNKETDVITVEFVINNDINELKYVGHYYSTIISRKQYTYDEVDNEENEDIKFLHNIANISYPNSHKMVEYWMILTNNTIGEIINNKGVGCFRHHPKPFNNQMTYMKRYLQHYYNDTNFINELKQSNNDPLFQYIYRDMMRKANYTSQSMSHYHYALNLNNYIHFTSPIRRAADIINHLILKNSEFDLDNEIILKYCDELNKGDIIQLEIEKLIKDEIFYENIQNNIIINGTIINIQKNFIEIYMEEYDITKYIHVSKLSSSILNFDEINNTLSNQNKIYKLFDKMSFMITNVNKIMKEFDLDIYQN